MNIGDRHEPELPDIRIVCSRQWLDMVAEAMACTYELGRQLPDGTFEPSFHKRPDFIRPDLGVQWVGGSDKSPVHVPGEQ
jgi:hypothetical protein